MSKRTILPWSIAALGALSGIGCERITSRRVEAIAADAKDAQRGGGESLLAGDTIPAGTSVRTPAHGRADLILLPNMLTRLEEKSEMRIVELEFAADGNETSGGVRERAARVQLREGRAVVSVEQHGYNTASLGFETSRGNFHADGDALFLIEEQKDFSSAVCLRGHVDAVPRSTDRVKTAWPGEIVRLDAAGVHHFALNPAERERFDADCAKAQAALALETTAQMEARR